MKWNNMQSVFGVVSSFMMLMAAPPVLFHSTCLVGWCAVQCRIRCSTVSLFCWHAGHVGESAFPIQYRCLASGACPVHSCIRMLVCFLGMSMISLRYLSDIAVRSVFLRSACCGEASHSFCTHALSFLLKSHFSADLLYGSVIFSGFGSVFRLLLPSVIAFLPLHLPFHCPQLLHVLVSI